MQRFALPIIFIGIAAFGVFWYAQPAYSDIQKIKDKTGEYEETLSKMTQLQKALNRKLSVRDSITGNQLKRLDRMLPESVKTVRLQIELDRIAAEHGLSIQKVSFSGAGQETSSGSAGDSGGPPAGPEDRPGPSGQPEASAGESQGGGYTTLTVSFSVSGSYEDIQSFLRDIEHSSRLMDVTAFQLSAPGANKDSSAAGSEEESDTRSPGTNSYKITLKTYRYNASGS